MTHEERLVYVRVILGSPSTTILPDEVINLFLSRFELSFDVDNHPENEPLVLWNTCVACLQWLLAASTAKGEISTSRSEKVGDVSVSFGGGVSQYQAWKDLLDYIYENPDYVDPSLGGFDNLIIIGGVRQDKYEEVLLDKNSRGPYSDEGIVKSVNIEYQISPNNPLVYKRWPR